MNKIKTLLDLQKALADFGMESEAVQSALELVVKAVTTKYMTELYAAVPTDVIEQVQTMGKDGATKVIHQAYLEKTGQKATDRLDEIIHLTVEDMIADPGKFFKKKSQ